MAWLQEIVCILGLLTFSTLACWLWQHPSNVEQEVIARLPHVPLDLRRIPASHTSTSLLMRPPSSPMHEPLRPLKSNVIDSDQRVRQIRPRPRNQEQQGVRIQCSQQEVWDDSHFSAEQDWVPMADGKEARAETLWRWVSEGSENRGHLHNEMSGGHLNARPEGYVRCHGNPPRHAHIAAPKASSTELTKFEVEYDRYIEHKRPCRRGHTVAFKFVSSGFVHVTQDGVIWAQIEQ